MTWAFFSLVHFYFSVHEAENEGPVTAKARVCRAMSYTSGYWQAVYMEMHTDLLHIHKQTHMLCVAGTSFTRRRQKFTKTHTRTHIPCNKEPTVCGGKMNCLYCIIRMSHQTVINENRMKVFIKREKCRHEKCLKTKDEVFGRNLELYLAFSCGGHRANCYSKINILLSTVPHQ